MFFQLVAQPSCELSRMYLSPWFDATPSASPATPKPRHAASGHGSQGSMELELELEFAFASKGLLLLLWWWWWWCTHPGEEGEVAEDGRIIAPVDGSSSELEEEWEDEDGVRSTLPTDEEVEVEIEGGLGD